MPGEDDDLTIDLSTLNLGGESPAPNDGADDGDDSEESPRSAPSSTDKKAPPAEEKKVVFTQAQLDKAVTDGELTQGQADRIIESQRTDAIADRVVSKTVARERDARVVTDLADYARLKPDLLKDGTSLRTRAAKEFKYLVDDLGMPNTKSTELAAVRRLLGPIDVLRDSKQVAETMQEGASGSEGGDGGRRRADTEDPPAKDGKPDPKLAATPPRGLTEREKAFYGTRVGRGKMYADWNAVRAEQKHANPGVRKRAEAFATTR